MPEVFSTRHSDGDERFLILCDHASNYVPPELDNLGLPPEHLTRHIAYDPGAVEVARFIADSLNCPLVEAGFSRLLIDPNRGLDDPTLIMKFSDGIIIPANRGVDRFNDLELWQSRVDTYYNPYHNGLQTPLRARRRRISRPLFCRFTVSHRFGKTSRALGRRLFYGKG